MMTLPTIMPAAAAPPIAPAKGTASASVSATASNVAKSGNPTNPATSNNPDADASATTAAPAPATATPSTAAWLSPGMRVPTLQPAAGPAATAATLAALTSDADESEPAPDPVETAEATALGTPEITKSVTEPVAFALNADAPAADTQQNSGESTPTDNMPSATAAAAAAQAAPLHNTAHSQPTMEAPPTLRAPVGSAAWTEQLGTQLTWMTRHGQDSASLHLSPDHLGPVDVRIDVRDGATSVWFGAAHPDTRSALEQSLPRLRELFAASGLLLADAGVARDAPRQNTRPIAPHSLAGSAGDTSISASQIASPSTHSGLVDTYV